MITKVRLRNWKSHLDTEFGFSHGVNALVGIMGSGKSSVMDGISFALFGTFPAHKAAKVSLDDLIMNRPQEKGDAEVGVEFSLNGKSYSVKRTLEAGKGTTHAEIREDGKLLDVNPRNVTEAVKRVLKMDYDLFSRAVYSEQNGLDYFLRIPRGKRTEHIDRMLKLDRFEKVREAGVSLANRVRQAREEKMRMVSDMEAEDFSGRIREVRREIAGLEKEAKSLEAEALKLRKERVNLMEKVSSAEKRGEEFNEMLRGLEGARGSLSEVSASLKKCEEALREKPGKLEAGVKSARKLVEEKRKKLDDAGKSLSRAQERMSVITESLEDVRTLGNRCPLCESEISADRRESLVADKEKELGSLEQEVQKVSKMVEPLQAELEKAEERLKSLELEAEKVSSAAKEAADLRKRKAVLGKRVTELEKVKVSVEKELAKEDLEAVRKDYQERLAEERGVLAKKSGLIMMLKEKGAALQDLEKRLETLKRYKEEAAQDEFLVNELKAFTEAVKATQEQLRVEFLRRVNQIMEGVWAELYPYQDFRGVRLVADDDYVLQLRGRDWISVDGIASGGERSLACLALRIAFSVAFIPNLRWLILDEPTHNLDSNAIEHLAAALRESIWKFAEQVFLITHEERISEGIGGSLYRLSRNKEMNEPTRVAGG